jgi:hypothetical protein
MKNCKKYLILGLTFVLILAGLTINVTSQQNKMSKENIPSSHSSRGWSDDFSSYTLGEFLDGEPTDGGWKGWDNDPTYGAFVVDDQEKSIPHSVEIAGDSDLVHEYTGYIAGQWTYIAWQYIPSDFVGETGFMLLNTYEDIGDKSWSVQLRFNADSGVVISDPDLNELILKLDQWVEIRVEIDLDADIQDIYYDGDLLVTKSWKDGVTGGGKANIGAVDLFANFATAVYYDDMSLTGEGLIPAICCQGELNWNDVAPGEQMSGEFEVSNCGDEGSLLNWEVSEWPLDWGTDWTFDPNSGMNLTTSAGWIPITVQFTAPNEKEKEFSGTIKVINSNNPEDFCEISVYLKTPRNKNIQNNVLLQLLQRLPIFDKFIQRLGL